jgi:hypothetical protein
VNQGAFHRCSSGHVKGSLLFVSRAGLPLTPPTRYPHGWGQCAFRALQDHRDKPVGVLFALRESRSPLQPVVTPAFAFAFSAPGTDDPSAPTWLGLRGLPDGVAEADCFRCAYADRSASTASTTESPRLLEFKHNKAGVSRDGSGGTGVPPSKPPSYATHAGPKPNQSVGLPEGSLPRFPQS